MRILILALTLVLALTLNAKEENSISKKDSIHFIDGVLIMANETISLDEFLFLAKKRYGRTPSSQNDEATVRYLRQAKKIIDAEKPKLPKEDREKEVRGARGVGGILSGAVIAAVGARLISTAGLYVAGTGGVLNGGCWVFCSESRKSLGGVLLGSGILIAGSSLVVAEGSAENTTTPLMISAHHNLEANRLIDKAVNRYNK